MTRAAVYAVTQTQLLGWNGFQPAYSPWKASQPASLCGKPSLNDSIYSLKYYDQ